MMAGSFTWLDDIGSGNPPLGGALLKVGIVTKDEPAVVSQSVRRFTIS